MDDFDKMLEESRIKVQKEIMTGYLLRNKDATPGEVYNHLRCIAAIGRSDLAEVEVWMSEIPTERRFVLRPKGEKGYGYEVLVDGIDIGDYISELTINLEGKSKCPVIDIVMTFGPRELEVDVPAEIKLKIEELK